MHSSMMMLIKRMIHICNNNNMIRIMIRNKTCKMMIFKMSNMMSSRIRKRLLRIKMSKKMCLMKMMPKKIKMISLIKISSSLIHLQFKRIVKSYRNLILFVSLRSCNKNPHSFNKHNSSKLPKFNMSIFLLLPRYDNDED